MEAKNEEIVSAEYLRNLFSSDQFIDINIKAGKRTERTGHETAYKFFKPIGKDTFKVSRIFEGNSVSTEGFEDELEKYHKAITASSAIYPLVSVHFHPNLQLIPSPQDLLNVHGSKIAGRIVYGYDLNPISIIGRKHDDIDLLLHQQKTPFLPEGLFGQMMNDLYDYSFCNEYNEISPDYPYLIAEKMRESGLYKTAIIKIRTNGKFNFNSKEIDDFSFAARKCVEEIYPGPGLSAFMNEISAFHS